MFGIDKSIIKNWNLKSIELKKILNRSNVIIQTQGYTTSILEHETRELIDIAYIKIKDEHKFNMLQFGVKVIKGRFIIYGFLEIHINSYENKFNNLEPLSINQYHKLIKDIEDYLGSEYGMHIDFTSSKFEMVELNKTIQLEMDFNEYKHILNMMSLLAPKTYRYKEIKMDNRNNIKSIVIFNDSVKCKIYNKTEQLLSVYKIELDKKYMRIEYILKGSKKIKSVFRDSSIFELTDEDIKFYLIERIDKELISPLEKYLKKSNKYLSKIVKEEKQKDSKKWTRAFVLRAISEKNEYSIPILFCNEQLKMILKKETKSNYARTLKNLAKDFERSTDFNKNISKLEELKYKLFK